MHGNTQFCLMFEIGGESQIRLDGSRINYFNKIIDKKVLWSHLGRHCVCSYAMQID